MTLPLLWVSLAFMAGILIASLAHMHVLAWVLALLAIIMGGILAYRALPESYTTSIRGHEIRVERRVFLLGMASLVALLLGAARYQASLPAGTSSQVSFYNDLRRDVLLSGTLTEPPDERDTYKGLRLAASEIDAGRGPVAVRGVVLARVGQNEHVRYGDLVRLRGELETPPTNEDFSYRDYLARQGIHSYMPAAELTVLPGVGGNPVLRAVYLLKETSLRNVYRLFLDPEASLLAGILLGVESGMPASVERAFNDTGTTHIIAISGFNIAVIAGIFAFLFNRWLGPARGALAALVGISFYTFFVGADPPVVRAALMGAVALLAVQVGRRQTGVNTLAFVGALMALWNPHVLWDVGFQLSFFATLGLIVYGGPFMDAARRFVQRILPAADAQRVAAPVGEFWMLTLAAQLTTLPIVAYHFRQVSLVSPLANAFILPAQPAVMVLGGAAVAASLLIFPLGQLIAWAAWPLTTYTIRAVEFFAGFPRSVVYLGRFSIVFVALFYVALFAVTIAVPRTPLLYQWLRARLRQLSLAASILVLFVCSVLVWRVGAAAPDGRLHVTFLDVGSADAVFIRTPSGGRVLINGGPSAAVLSDALGRRMSPFDHRLDWLIVASADEHQVASLPRLLPRFRPDRVLFGAPEQASFSAGALRELLIDEAIPMERAEVGQVLNLGDGAELQVIDVSSIGTTLLLEWDSFRLLLPIGVSLDTLEALEVGATVGPVNGLLLAQSGYAPLLPPEWLENLHPQVVVISVAPADRDGLPSPETLEALEGYPVLRTDENGWIEVVTDGASMWVSSERQPPEGLE